MKKLSVILCFIGSIVEEGLLVVGFAQASVPPGQNCVSEERICKGGQLGGGNTFAGCSIEVYPSCTLAGEIIKHGESVFAFVVGQVAAGSICPASKLRNCDKGALSGVGEYTNCTVRQVYIPPPSPPPHPPPETCQKKGFSNTSWDFVNGGLFTWSPTRSTNPATIPETYGTGWLKMAYLWGGVTYDYWWCPYTSN